MDSVDQTDSNDPAIQPEVSDDLFAPPADVPREPDDSADPFGDASGPMDDAFGTTDDALGAMDDSLGPLGDQPSPFDVPDSLFSEMDELPADSGQEPSRSPDVHFVPTPQEVVDRMLELVNVTEDDVVYDLGCGDGRIVVTAAKRYGCRALGVDIDPQRVEESLENVRENNVEHLVEIQEGDIFQLDLTPASVITLYLLPELNVRLIPQLEKLKPGTRIVSHAFDMRGMKPDKIETIEAERGTSHRVYLWTTPLTKQADSQQQDSF